MAAAERCGWPLLAVLAGGFLAGIYLLFSLRFAGGDLFPPYSTLRADPLGAKALFTALERLGPLTLTRNYLPLERLTVEPPATLFLLGADPGLLCDCDAAPRRELERLARAGYRVVIPFATREAPARPPSSSPKEADETPPPPSPKTDVSVPSSLSPDDAADWGVTLEPVSGSDPASPEAASPPVAAVPETLAALPVHTGWVLRPGDPAWTVRYRAGREAVVLERSFGAGSVVLLAESYLLSNEAMRTGRDAPFLAWLAGPHPRIVFDERHLGLAEQPGVMALTRGLRLHWFLAALLGLTALFAWQRSVPLVPLRPEAEAAAAGIGEDQFAGLVQLLRRHLTAAELLPTCVREWRRSLPPRLARRQGQVEEIVRRHQSRPPRQRNPLQAYHEVARALSERTPHEP